MILKKVSELCKKKGISIAKLERELGIGNGTVGKWASSSPTVDNVKKVADYFGVTVDELIAEEQSRSNDNAENVR